MNIQEKLKLQQEATRVWARGANIQWPSFENSMSYFRVKKEESQPKEPENATGWNHKKYYEELNRKFKGRKYN